MIKHIYLSIAIFISFLFSNTLSLSVNEDGTWNVNYFSDESIAGFQFNVDGATVLNATGGISAENGFTVSAGGATVLGFSFTGATIPAGDGILIQLEVQGDPTGLSAIVISDTSGEAIDFDLYEASEDQLKNLNTVATSLENALDSLLKDKSFLTEGGVFTDDQIEGYIELKRDEVSKLNNSTHPVEFDMYYSV